MRRCFIRTNALMVAVLVVHMPAFAEMECVSQISYRWEYTPPSPSPREMQKEGEENAAPDQMAKESYLVSYVTRRLHAVTEEDGKRKFQIVLEKDKADAMAECQAAHENLSGCISVKFMAMGPVLRQLDFNARKDLAQSISTDCRRATGRCLKSESSEIVCSEVALVTEEERGKKGDENKGDEKKGKK